MKATPNRKRSPGSIILLIIGVRIVDRAVFEVILDWFANRTQELWLVVVYNRNLREIATLYPVISEASCTSQQVNKSPNRKDYCKADNAPQIIIAPLGRAFTATADKPNNDADDDPQDSQGHQNVYSNVE